MSGVFDLKNAIRMEVTSSFDLEDVKAVSFEEFWDIVDAQNAYEEEWEEHKENNVKEIYREIYQGILKGEIK